VIVSLGVSLVILFISIIDLNSKIPEGLINFSIKSFQGFPFSFNPIKFTSGVFSNMFKVFQDDVPLSGVLLLVFFNFSSVINDTHLLVLVNFRILFSF